MSTTRIVKLGRERTLSTLARKVFEIGTGAGSRDLLRRAEAALLAANPRLRSADGFRTGASIVVPAVAGLRPTGVVIRADLGGDALGVEAELRLQVAASRVEDAFQTAAVDRKQTQERISDRNFAAEARRALPETRDHIAKTLERFERDEQTETEARERMLKNIDAATEALATLNKMVPQPRRR
ncbi:hypothetical protein [Ruegeria sp. HKCCD8929]|uniref:hypothetical protein n=1 Tax=Ruegeria sp. HKCCD8929 TaxID=2683006 RepID=UPI001487AFE0|nr:hypothetical protein [Ruegeria sp. HKCCD8929]